MKPNLNKGLFDGEACGTLYEERPSISSAQLRNRETDLNLAGVKGGFPVWTAPFPLPCSREKPGFIAHYLHLQPY